MQIYGSGTKGYANTAQVNDEGFLYMAGSISSIPSISVDPATTATDYKISGTHTGIGSAVLIAGDFGGSVQPIRIFGGSYVMMAGSISSIPSISTSAANVYKMSGNAVLPGSLGLIGGLFNGSVYPLKIETGSQLVIVGSVRQLGEINISAGSVTVIGISAGSVEVFQTTNADLQVQATQEGIWDVGITTDPVAVSGNALGVSGTAFEQVWVGVGSMVISGTSVPVSRGVGSVVISGTSIPVFRGIGSVLTTGVGSVVISGTSIPVFRGIGSVRVSNAEPIRTTQDRGIFFNSGATIHDSGTATVIHTPGTGSNVLLKGFTVSAELATHFRLIFSGGTPTHIAEYNLPNSGTVAMNLIGMEPSGAVNQPISVGLFNAGSVHVTVFGQDTL